MDGMDPSMIAGMGSMGGMDESSDGMFFDTNSALARIYWYIVAGVVGVCLILRGITALSMSWRCVKSRAELNRLDTGGKSNMAMFRIRHSRARSIAHPTKPSNLVSQSYATITAIAREISYPQPQFLVRSWFDWLNPPALGRILLLLSYWVLIIAFLTVGAIVDDAYYWERIGFRAAWVSVTQVPLIFLLASKVSIVGHLSGTSYERLNWLHRWVSRTLLITVTVHGSFFFTEWVRADFVPLELAMMPMVKYGLGAWAVLLWNLFSSLVPIRRLAYEFFVLQHIAAAAVFLWLLWVHVPDYAAYNIWLAIGFWVFDRVARFCWQIYQNVTVRRTAVGEDSPWIGYRAELRTIADNITVLTLRNVSFSWKAGQHFYLWFPRIGLLESHPFTVSNLPTKGFGCNANAEFVIRSHTGFTRRLYRRALLSNQSVPLVERAIVMGPFGHLPGWNAFETLVLISGGTGASFMLPILESVVNEPGCIQQIDFLLLVRTKKEARYYVDRLSNTTNCAQSSHISLRIQVAVKEDYGVEEETMEKASSTRDKCQLIEEAASTSSSTSASIIQYQYGRVNLGDYIRGPVEESGGETSVAVCAGKTVVARVRNAVARLSDERAVHKGTGAQGIHLHVEEYCY